LTKKEGWSMGSHIEVCRGAQGAGFEKVLSTATATAMTANTDFLIQTNSAGTGFDDFRIAKHRTAAHSFSDDSVVARPPTAPRPRPQGLLFASFRASRKRRNVGMTDNSVVTSDLWYRYDMGWNALASYDLGTDGTTAWDIGTRTQSVAYLGMTPLAEAPGANPSTAAYRHYAPTAARWAWSDPLGMVDGPNVYGYVGGNPVKHVDINGTSISEELHDLYCFLRGYLCARGQGVSQQVKCALCVASCLATRYGSSSWPDLPECNPPPPGAPGPLPDNVIPFPRRSKPPRFPWLRWPTLPPVPIFVLDPAVFTPRRDVCRGEA